MKRKLKKLAITCGGTGGHFYPGLAVAREFKAQGGDVILLLAGRHVEAQAATAAGFGVDAIKLRPMPSPGNLGAALRFGHGMVSGVATALRALKSFKPDALLAMGSFASLPPALAAKLLNIPIFLHDGNARIGKANRYLSRWAKHLGTAFPAVNAAAVKCPCECVGMPLRPELTTEQLTKSAAIKQVNEQFDATFLPELPTLLIFGGSQGAQVFNETFPRALLERDDHRFQVIHLTGKGKIDKVNALYAQAKFSMLCLPATNQMHLLYQAADAVVCRSGGSTVAELCLFGKFAFLAPYPYAAELHQNDNAAFLANAGAAEVISNAACNLAMATEIIARWLKNPGKFTDAGKLALPLAKPDAARTTLQIIAN